MSKAGFIFDDYEAGWQYGYQLAGTMVIFAPLQAVPCSVLDRKAYTDGFRDGFHAYKTSLAESEQG